MNLNNPVKQWHVWKHSCGPGSCPVKWVPVYFTSSLPSYLLHSHFITSFISVRGTPSLPPSCPDMQQRESDCSPAARRDVCGQDKSPPQHWNKLKES